MARPLLAVMLATCCRCLFLLMPFQGECVDPYGGLRLDLGIAEDSLALLQHAVQPRRQQVTARLGFGDDPSSLPGAPGLPSMEELWCASFPSFCKEPFNCQNYTDYMALAWLEQGLAPDGKPNYFNWCSQSDSSAWMSKCAAGDLLGSAKTRYFLVNNGMYGGLKQELDGSACFLEGHCTNTAVTENTTAEETAAMCDKQYGHEAWTRFGSSHAPPENAIGFGMENGFADYRNGYLSHAQSRPFALASCAMGSFHCDVVYCRENYCKDEYYIKKYGHFLKEEGWVK
uniref:Uncharacterized protein n=1 Tax=Alexandrium andersonii TaxID=327968 RepID=A0A7S2ACV4_9DINO|mmetsp:Transcript_10066/g.22911  ORF Transcript_10066/g.22911 Transcript_10066/m.22911 type:complete len:286 (+) Transcript_10066:111-968(+)